jgi:hypothetical protein
MARYHINPATGDPGVCSAVAGNCPFKGDAGEESTHYPSAAAAREGYEEAQRSPFTSLVKPETTAEVTSFDEAPAEDTPTMISGSFTVNHSIPDEAWTRYQSKWDSQGLTELSNRLDSLRRLNPGTVEYEEAFSNFAKTFAVEADKLRDNYAVTTGELIVTKAAFRETTYGQDNEAKVQAAYAYLDSYAASDKVNQVTESLVQMKDQLRAQLAFESPDAQASYDELEADDRRRWEGLASLPAWEKEALETPGLSSVQLIRYQHLGGSFVKRYEEALAAEEESAKPQGFFSRFRRPSITSVR